MKPNLIWITIDSIRYDRTSFSESDRDTTPNLMSLAQQDDAYSFESCHAHGIWSLPSSGSILTGQYPSEHGLGETEILSEDIKTVPERLSEVDYETAAVSANPWFSKTTGLNRGFDEFQRISLSNLPELKLSALLAFVARLRQYSTLSTDKRKHRNEYLTISTVKDYIDRLESSGGPFFLYAHTEGVHTPYHPPDAYLNKFTDELEMSARQARQFVFNAHENLHREIASGLNYTEDEWTAFEAMYDGLLKYVDSQIGRLISTIDSIDRPTILVITSDHGDMIGECGLLSHKLALHQGLTHVPCIVAGDGVDLGDCTSDLVQHIDIIKELVTTVGANTEGMSGHYLSQEKRDFAVCQRSADHYDDQIEKLQKYEPEFGTEQYFEGFTSAVWSKDGGYKLITNGDREAVYDLSGEKRTLVESRPDVGTVLQEELKKEVTPLVPNTNSEQADFSRQMEKQLEDLGYL